MPVETLNFMVFLFIILFSCESLKWIPTEAGDVPYFCMVHPWMQGVIIVQEAGAEEEEHNNDFDRKLSKICINISSII